MEFESEDVAKIVAETMNNYLFGERLLKCKCACLPIGLGTCCWVAELLSYLAIPPHFWDDSLKDGAEISSN